MPWHKGAPPKDGNDYVCRTPEYDGIIILRWYKYNGLEAFRDWDTDIYKQIDRWHDLL